MGRKEEERVERGREGEGREGEGREGQDREVEGREREEKIEMVLGVCEGVKEGVTRVHVIALYVCID